jgi:hypothetical protein
MRERLEDLKTDAWDEYRVAQLRGHKAQAGLWMLLCRVIEALLETGEC